MQKQDNLNYVMVALYFSMRLGICNYKRRPKSFRAIQEGEIQRVGATKIKKVDVRLLAATHKNLEEMVSEKSFREDLYYRLNVVRIETPPFATGWKIYPNLLISCFKDWTRSTKRNQRDF